MGTGFGSSGVPYSTDLATYPRDVYEVLFNRLIFNAHGNAELVAGLENTILIVLILQVAAQSSDAAPGRRSPGPTSCSVLVYS